MIALIFDLDDTLVVEEASAEVGFLKGRRSSLPETGIDTIVDCWSQSAVECGFQKKFINETDKFFWIQCIIMPIV